MSYCSHSVSAAHTQLRSHGDRMLSSLELDCCHPVYSGLGNVEWGIGDLNKDRSHAYGE